MLPSAARSAHGAGMTPAVALVIAVVSALLGYVAGGGVSSAPTTVVAAGPTNSATPDSQVTSLGPSGGLQGTTGGLPALPGTTGGSGTSGGPVTTGAADSPGVNGAACPDLSCGPLTASDQGVTATTIKLGMLIPNLNKLHAAGYRVGPIADWPKIAKAWDNEITRLGGLHGRKVVWVFQEFDVLDNNDMQAKCKTMTEDEKVFAVFNAGGFDSVAQLCIAKDHKVPYFGTDAEPEDWYKQAAPYLWGAIASKDRLMLNQVAWLTRTKRVTPATKVGVIYQDVPQVAPSVTKTLLPALNRAGIKPVRVVALPADNGQALNQINVAVTQMVTAGVTYVMFSNMNLIFKTQFLQVAEGQNWFPTYDGTESYFGCQDFTTAAFSAKAYQGTTCMGISQAGAPTPTGLRRTPYTDYADQVYKRTYPEGYANAGDSAQSREDQEFLNRTWGSIALFLRGGLRKAGTQPTRATYVQALQMIPNIEGGLTCRASTGPGKFTLSDGFQLVEWHAEAGNGFATRRYRAVGSCFNGDF